MKKKKIIITLICFAIIVGIICVVIFNNFDYKLSKYFTDIKDNYITTQSIDINFIDNGIDKYMVENDNKTIYPNMDVYTLEINNQKFQIGREYQEEISVKNNQMDCFLRVIIYKKWIDANGNEDTALDGNLIGLGLATEEDGWILDKSVSTDKRIVLYYRDALGEGEETSNFMNYVKIDSALQNEAVTEEKIVGDGYKIININKKYKGYKFELEIEAQAVQTHNAEDAMQRAWGADITLSEDGSTIVSVN